MKPTSQRGSITVWTAVLIPACMLLVGLVVDGGAVLRERSKNFDLAGGAARAAAQELDPVSAAAGAPRIDPLAARAAAERYLAGSGVSASVEVRGSRVTVTVRSRVHLQFLRPATVATDQSATAVAVAPGGSP